MSDAELLDLGSSIRDRFGLKLQDLEAAPTIDEIELRESRVKSKASLEHLLSADKWSRAEHTLGKNLGDFVRGLERKYDNPPDLVAFPEDEGDVVDILDWAEEEGLAVIPFGGGSSVAQGIEPIVPDTFRGVISLDLRKLSRVLEIDRESRSARIQGGVLGPHMEDQLRPHGYSMRFFLQAFEFSSLGGWIATRAAGHFATGFTQIDDYVQSMRVVTPTGVMSSRRLPCDGAGVSDNRMFIGSEGTMGVITEAWMRLQDRPSFRASMSVPFSKFEAGVGAIRALSQSGLYPSNCRLLDPVESLLSGAGDGDDTILIVAFESADHDVTPWMNRALEICREFGGRVESDKPADSSQGAVGRTGAGGRWRNFFVKGPYYKEGFARMGILRETFETACTWSAFPELHARVVEAATKAVKKECGEGAVACRFTHVYPDGPAPYYTVIGSARRGGEVEQWAAIKAAASEAVLEAGGTITHHHAVGRFHRPWYDQQRSDVFAAALTGAKRAVDPGLIMNPGVLVDA
ncbi:FAD-binding oxidoreductase [Ruania albidiflava]|uniref:FAD-binding oxidoreductase n=1 Tax=Ruania albidiflava TaxID=366586 RepID=UPI001B7FA1E6|nr:FAD-binding oxidoreductase [Ruania albidiflava]